MFIDGVVSTWFVMTGLSLAFVAIDIPRTPESVVLKWAFVILVAFTGPLGAMLYVLGCREPLKGTHAQYVSATWRQVLGSTMHCAAGDGIGIVAGAAVGAFLSLGRLGDFGLEYVLGFGFGWMFFQAFAMRDMVGGSYLHSLRETFVPEFLSMNLLMAGMFPTMGFLMNWIEGADDPASLRFWFVMSMAMIAGFILAYPVNWWLVTNNLKHGMLTVPVAAPETSLPGAYDADGKVHVDSAHIDSAHIDSARAESAHVQGVHAGGDSGVDGKSGHGAASGTARHGEGGSGHGGHSAGKRPSAGVVFLVGLLSVAILAVVLLLSGVFGSGA